MTAPPAPAAVGPILAALLFSALLAAIVWSGLMPLMVPALYIIASATAFLLYAIDKAAARANRRRIPENTLHAIALCGGWPGAWIARRVLRHKTRKQPFRALFHLTLVINCLLLAAFVVRAAPAGA